MDFQLLRRVISMNFRLLSVSSVLSISLATGLALAQDNKSTTSTPENSTTTQENRSNTPSTTQDGASTQSGNTQGQQSTTEGSTPKVTSVTQHPDGSWTVIEYPVDKEIVVDLNPTTLIPEAKGKARVKRSGSDTAITLDITGLPSGNNTYHLYTVDSAGKVASLGPITINNGTGTLNTKTALNKFMLVLSPEANLTNIESSTKVALRSVVPQGFAVIPVAHSGSTGNAAIGERVKASTTPGTTSAYNVPMLGIPSFRRGTDTHMRVNFSGELTGSRANIFIEPRKDGPTTIKMRFHELKNAPANKRLVLWAVGSDNTYTRLGQVINTGTRNEAEIESEVALKDFGLFVTTEDVNEPPQPSGAVVATIINEKSEKPKSDK
jgi:hypothetical protein